MLALYVSIKFLLTTDTLCTPIDVSNKSHSAPVPYPTMHHFVTKMCIHVEHFCYKMLHYGIFAWCMWDLWDWLISMKTSTKIDVDILLIFICTYRKLYIPEIGLNRVGLNMPYRNIDLGERHLWRQVVRNIVMLNCNVSRTWIYFNPIMDINPMWKCLQVNTTRHHWCLGINFYGTGLMPSGILNQCRPRYCIPYDVTRPPVNSNLNIDK